MRPRSLNFATAQADPRSVPLIVVAVTTAAGVRVFCASGMTDDEVWAELGALADGTYVADGSLTAGAQLLPVIAIQPIVLSYGAMRDTGSILPTILLRGQRAREVGNMEIALRNDDDTCGKMLSQDLLLGGTLTVATGFRGLRRDQFVTRFAGVVQEILLTKEQLTIRAETA